MKIVWARESGATREQQLGWGTQSQQLVDSAYSYYKRGSAPEIRAAVEAECVADKERQAAALAATAARIQGTAPAPSPSSQGPSADDLARFQQRQDAEIAANQESLSLIHI